VSHKKKILVVDDESAIRKFLRASLEREDVSVLECSTGEEGIRAVATENPDILLLDLGLPDLEGLEVVKRVREWSTVPIVILSARDQEEQKILTLDAGADDYLTKPFTIGELEARMRVALRRRTDPEQPSVIHVEELEINLTNRTVLRAGKEVHLTPLEFKLLAFLARHSGKVLTHKQILTEVWGAAYARQNHYLRVFMGQLRHKLEADPAQPKFLTTESGVGYRFKGA
jgi:two-component system, OmpR family, KDP operon response regulator KdpE